MTPKCLLLLIGDANWRQLAARNIRIIARPQKCLDTEQEKTLNNNDNYQVNIAGQNICQTLSTINDNKEACCQIDNETLLGKRANNCETQYTTNRNEHQQQDDDGDNDDDAHLLEPKAQVAPACHKRRPVDFGQLISCPASASVLYASTTLPANCVLIVVLALTLLTASPNYNAVAANGSEQKQITTTTTTSSHAPTNEPAHAFDWQRAGAHLIKQLGTATLLQPMRNRERWITLGVSGQNTRDQYRRPPPPLGPNRNWLSPITRPGATGQTFRRTWNTVRARLGERNSIRVHNAFRDLAWRILSRLSMPTPVIYELRRQNFYTPEEDTLNDMMFNKNTSKTIRTKRTAALASHIDVVGRQSKPLEKPSSGAQRRDYEDDEPDSLQERIRTRLEDLISLSRRNLFGRVVRLPSLFPFKRQQNDDDGPVKYDNFNSTNSSSNKKSNQKTQTTTTKQRLSRRKRKRRRESDRQMISINGKQYYVDDDTGELKELKDDLKEEAV